MTAAPELSTEERARVAAFEAAGEPDEVREARWRMSDADIARVNGWGVGTRLVGDEGYGPTTIELTAIGRTQVLAVVVAERGLDPRHGREGNWTFRYRDWQVAS